ncbi:MAG: hypothetical protein H6606_08960 [Flavobacteriales bacterium]|nr:hypothetical protein [Flavobacteriales bacterium]
MNFFYGLGAAVILIAALFKFVGWKHADVLFMVGLIGEAIIFLVAGLQPVPRYVDRPGADPAAEQFQLTRESVDALRGKKINSTPESANALRELNLMLNTLNEASRKLDELTERYETQNKEMELQRAEYRKQIESVRTHIEATRKRLNELERSTG